MHRRVVLRPELMKLAELLVRDIRAGGDTIDTLIEIDQQFPNLSFTDFTAAAVVAAELAIQPEGRT